MEQKPKKNRHEPGYRSVLIREQTKERLRRFRDTLQYPDNAQERRLVTAAIEMVIDDSDLHTELLRRVDEVIVQEIQDRQAERI